MKDMNFRNINTDIEQIKICYKDIILDTLVESKNNIISWGNYSPGISKKMYAKEFEELKNNRQYSFLLKNNGFIQIYYDFSNEKLNKAKLAYYPYPVVLKEAPEEIENYFDTTEDKTIGEYYFDIFRLIEAELGKEISNEKMTEMRDFCQQFNLDFDEYQILLDLFEKKYELTNSSHIRIDYDDKVTSHHKTEIQYSSINNIRLPLNKIISPFLFMDFIVRYEFPDFYNINKISTKYVTGYSLALRHSGNIRKFKENNIFISHL